MKFSCFDIQIIFKYELSSVCDVKWRKRSGPTTKICQARPKTNKNYVIQTMFKMISYSLKYAAKPRLRHILMHLDVEILIVGIAASF